LLLGSSRRAGTAESAIHARYNGRTMATGWAKEGAVQDQIDATVKDAIQRAKSRLPEGPGLTHCAECGAQIAPARQAAIPGVRLCLDCQNVRDQEVGTFSGYNRRGSKDSQLR
jgi:RNA polymerase-binding transcription factor DksA